MKTYSTDLQSDCFIFLSQQLFMRGPIVPISSPKFVLQLMNDEGVRVTNPPSKGSVCKTDPQFKPLLFNGQLY